ncbi:MAG: glutamine-hydrolyzing GMP synthase, partial [Bacteroidales bacterium]|nr:glutamine-hydrolyzing GMP synthase [Bacteroidales bacterium]
MEEMILILDFGSQYTQLIARRVRELNVYCEIHPYNDFPAVGKQTKGVILSGSPFSVRDDGAPMPDLNEIRKKFPVVGLCYGAQLMALQDGGEVLASEIREYGRANLSHINIDDPLLQGMTTGCQVWMSHGDTILHLPDDFEMIASTDSVEVAGFKIAGEPTYGIQFHPEVYHTKQGKQLLENFLVTICGCKQDWTPSVFADDTIKELKEKLSNDKVVLGL